MNTRFFKKDIFSFTKINKIRFYEDLQLFDGNFVVDYRINLDHYFVNVVERFRLIYELQQCDMFVPYKSLREAEN